MDEGICHLGDLKICTSESHLDASWSGNIRGKPIHQSVTLSPLHLSLPYITAAIHSNELNSGLQTLVSVSDSVLYPSTTPKAKIDFILNDPTKISAKQQG